MVIAAPPTFDPASASLACWAGGIGAVLRWMLLLAASLSACAAPAAQTRWLPPPLPTVEPATASRDAPAFELAYGPRPQASLGAQLPLVRRGRYVSAWQAGTTALVALENGSSYTAMPLELMRAVYGLDIAWLGRSGPDSWSLGLGLAREQVRTLGQVIPPDSPRPDDIAFGGGGTWLALRAGWHHPAAHWTGTVALEERAHLAGLRNIAGLRVVGDVLGDLTGDALTHAPQLDATIRWRPRRPWQPLVSLHADLQIPGDEFARLGWFARLLLGAAHPSAYGETLPFLSLDAGNGKGYLIGRRELRLSAGVRHGFF